jgi:hypothetical protein
MEPLLTAPFYNELMIPTTVEQLENEVEQIRRGQAERIWLIVAWSLLTIGTVVGYFVSHHGVMIFLAGTFLCNAVAYTWFFRRNVERIARYKGFAAKLEELANPKTPLTGSFGKVTTARIPQRRR